MPLKKSSDKDTLRSQILRHHSFGTKSRALILLDIQDSEIREFFVEVGKNLDIAFIIPT